VSQPQSVVPYIHFHDVWQLRQLAGYPLLLPDDEPIVDDAEIEAAEAAVSPADEERELLFLRSLDPKEWKNQDHYAVLGIKTMRWQATDRDIKTAYRRMVLKHHPDKRKARGEVVADESTDYFTCITRAWETLGSRDRRRAYDSVDPQFDNTVPTASDVTRGGADFFAVFGPAFAANSRWSRRQPVPQLGTSSDSRETVEDFYSFWYDFDSWREFSYLDEEDKEKGENREERRWIERQNREARQRRRRDETRRLRGLVDAARDCDPRLARFKEEEARAKQKAKQAKAEAAEQRRRAAETAEAEAAAARRAAEEAAEAAARAEAERQRRDREAVKKALKEARKAFRALAKSADFFLTAGDADSVRVARMEAVGLLADGLEAGELMQLRDRLAGATDGAAGPLLEAAVTELRERRRAETEAAAVQQKERKQAAAADSGGAGESQWNYGQLCALVKAVKLFPAGTGARWEKVAEYVNAHWEAAAATSAPMQQPQQPVVEVDAKSALRKAKELAKNSSDDALRAEANRQAAGRVAAEAAKATTAAAAAATADSDISQRDPACVPTPWSAEEQRLLEAALRKFPASDPDRWDRVASAVGSRTKRDCMVRYKELVRMIQAKKAAAAK
ncbi:hypothetical protein BOX15_Mlig001986g3, partial [Macrostomum lignano]